MERFLTYPLVLWLVFFCVSWPFFLALQWAWWGLLWLLAREGALITIVVPRPNDLLLAVCAAGTATSAAGGLLVTATAYTEQLTALKVGRKHQTEFHIALHSPVTGLSWQFLVYGNSRHAANLAALTYAREETGNPTWRTLVIQDVPSDPGVMRMEFMSLEEMDAEEEPDWDDF